MNEDAWTVLGIDADADKRDIKRAYAKLLKKTRPDDDPEGFQRLHAAYKAALVEAEYRDAAPAENVININNLHSVETPGVTVVFDPAKDPEDFAGERDGGVSLSDTERREIDESLAAVDRVLEAPMRLPVVRNWEFLTTSPSLLEEDFRIELGRQVIHKIIEHNKKQGSKAVPPYVVSRLDEVFFWTSSPFAFAGPADADDIFGVVVQIEPSQRRSHANPVGGNLVKVNKPKPRPAGQEYQDYNGPPVWVFIIMMFAAVKFIRACAESM